MDDAIAMKFKSEYWNSGQRSEFNMYFTLPTFYDTFDDPVCMYISMYMYMVTFDSRLNIRVYIYRNILVSSITQ